MWSHFTPSFNEIITNYILSFCIHKMNHLQNTKRFALHWNIFTHLHLNSHCCNSYIYKRWIFVNFNSNSLILININIYRNALWKRESSWRTACSSRCSTKLWSVCIRKRTLVIYLSCQCFLKQNVTLLDVLCSKLEISFYFSEVCNRKCRLKLSFLKCWR